ncbi:MAG: hypothetical protein M1358_10825 [Chloroflexi bacterium]|nr:hypothetical protein [Chloroflexota bacterium]
MAESSALVRIRALVDAPDMHPAEKELRILCRTTRGEGPCPGPLSIMVEFLRFADPGTALAIQALADDAPYPIKVRLNRIEEQLGSEWALNVLRDEVERARILN